MQGFSSPAIEHARPRARAPPEPTTIPRTMADQPPKSLARSLGEFFGHIWHGVKTDPAPGAGPGQAPERHTVKHHVQEETSPDGQITLRRTTIEEIEVRRQP